MKKLFFVALSLISFSSFAGIEEGFAGMIDDEINRLRAVNMSTSRYSDRDANPACKRRYRSLYRKGKIRIVYGFGYSDAGEDGNVVLDHYSYKSLRSRLLRRCTPDTYMCGFVADRNDPNLLRKAEQDSTGEKNYIVEIKLVHGSLSGDDVFNTSPENIEQQKALCLQATNTYLNEIANGADVVIYNGHSRDGGGPDFCPPVRASNHHVDYNWYHKNRPGIKGVLSAMKIAVDNQRPNSVVGFFSCSSKLHFLNKLMAVNNSAGYVLTQRLSTFEEMMRDSYAALDSLLAQRCEEGYKKSFDVRGTSTWFNMFR